MNLKKCFGIVGVACLASLVILGGSGVYLLNSYYNVNDIKGLPDGELLLETESPDEKYTLKMYRINGGATVDWAVKGEITNKFGMSKDIYWEYHEKDAIVNWISEDTVIINDKPLCVVDESFDWRVN